MLNHLRIGKKILLNHIMKPSFKPKKELSARQKELMKTHSNHYTQKHLDNMKTSMLKGYCFEQAHALAKKKIGK
jgi:hypothetical protein